MVRPGDEKPAELRDRFLERFWHDYARDALLDPSSYKRLFPGAEALIDAEFAAHEAGLSSLVVTLAPAAGESMEPTPDVIGAYRLLGCVGRGGMGLVFKAIGLDGRQYALKLPRAELSLSVVAMRRFRRELRLSSILRHRNLLHAVDGGVHEGRPYLVTDFIAGGSLGEIVTAEGRLPVGEARVVLTDGLEALAALEAAQLIHRDVKPGNILVGGDGICRLADHGLARSIRPERSLYTRGGDFLGTFAFASPEQLRSQDDLDARTDLFALGVTVASLLLGRPPQLGRTLTEVLNRRLEEPVTAHLHHLPGLPPELLRCLTGLSALVRDDRPATARTALAEFRAAKLSALDSDRRSLGGKALELARSRGTPTPDSGPNWKQELRRAPYSMLLKGLAKFPAGGERRAAPNQGLYPPAAKLRLELLDPDRGPGELILHGGSSIVLGGLRPEQPAEILTLPFEADDARSRRISARHLQIRIEGEDALVEDLRSTGGSKLDGIPLIPDCPELLGLTSVLELAAVLTLQIRVAGAGSHTVVWIEDADPRQARSQVLVPDTVALGRDLQIQFRKGAFWGVVGSLRRRLRAGDVLEAGPLRALVRDLDPPS